MLTDISGVHRVVKRRQHNGIRIGNKSHRAEEIEWKRSRAVEDYTYNIIKRLFLLRT